MRLAQAPCVTSPGNNRPSSIEPFVGINRAPMAICGLLLLMMPFVCATVVSAAVVTIETRDLLLYSSFALDWNP